MVITSAHNPSRTDHLLSSPVWQFQVPNRTDEYLTDPGGSAAGPDQTGATGGPPRRPSAMRASSLVARSLRTRNSAHSLVTSRLGPAKDSDRSITWSIVFSASMIGTRGLFVPRGGYHPHRPTGK